MSNPSPSSGEIWRETGWYVEPETARGVMNTLGSIGVYAPGQRFDWRGMSRADFKLSSVLHRRLGLEKAEADLRAAELQLLRDARDWGLGIGDTAYINDLHLLADLQHYGIATRFIDFTSIPTTALWLSVAVSFESGDPEHLSRELRKDEHDEDSPNLPFVAVIIRSELKARLLEYLKGTYNRTPKVLFPNYAGFKQYAAHGGERALGLIGD